MLHEWWLIIGVVINTFGYFLYGLGIRRQLVAPSRASWLIWSVAMGIEALTYQSVNQGAAQNIFFLVSATCCIATTIAVWSHSSWQRPSLIDSICLIACFASLILWFGYQNVWWAHLSILFTIPVSFLPTWARIRENRQFDNSPAWGLWAISDLLVILTIVGNATLEIGNELPYAITEFVCNAVTWVMVGLITIDPRRTFRIFKGGIGVISTDKMSGHVFLIGRNKTGKAVYAGQHFLRGQQVIEFRGPVYERSVLPNEVDNATDRFLQIDHNLFIGPSNDVDDLINHSCDPNGGIKFTSDGRVNVIALKTIDYGDELTIDYSTTSIDHGWSIKCLCGSINCRGIIGDFRLLPTATKQLYKNLDILPSYIIKVMNEDSIEV